MSSVSVEGGQVKTKMRRSDGDGADHGPIPRAAPTQHSLLQTETGRFSQPVLSLVTISSFHRAEFETKCLSPKRLGG